MKPADWVLKYLPILTIITGAVWYGANYSHAHAEKVIGDVVTTQRITNDKTATDINLMKAEWEINKLRQEEVRQGTLRPQQKEDLKFQLELQRHYRKEVLKLKG